SVSEPRQHSGRERSEIHDGLWQLRQLESVLALRLARLAQRRQGREPDEQLLGRDGTLAGHAEGACARQPVASRYASVRRGCRLLEASRAVAVVSPAAEADSRLFDIREGRAPGVVRKKSLDQDQVHGIRSRGV